jgi:Uma2 family endonuclease
MPMPTSSRQQQPNLSATEAITLEAYFELEWKAETKHEFHNGILRAMAYTSPAHGDIQTNLMDALSVCLSKEGCKRYTSDRMVYVRECNKVFYPDLVIVCGEHQMYDYKAKMKATLNPTVLIEILSDSTENEDKIDKWDCYRKIKSLKQYIMVEQKSHSVHLYNRLDERQWAYTYADEPEDTIEIQDCTITLKDIYKSVEF